MAEEKPHACPSTLDKVIPFYVKYRTQIWTAVFFVIGLLGGNVDRLKPLVPDLTGVGTAVERVDKLEGDVKNLGQSQSNIATVVDELNVRMSELTGRVAKLEADKVEFSGEVRIK